MTVCIALMCEGGKKIVAVSDHMLSMESFSGDNLALKIEPIHRNWFALWSGDVSYIPLVLDVATHILCKKDKPNQHDAAEAMTQAHSNILEREINNQVLSRLGYNLQSFRKVGKEQLTASVYNSIHREIKAVSLDAEFLVCGFDEEGDGHIFTLEKNGALKSCDAAGFWAIGSGTHNALSAIFFHATKNGINQNSPLADALYVACEAKFMAESAVGIGKKTFVNI